MRSDGPKPREFRILSLAGGGYLGLYSAEVLAGLERRVGEPLARRFDLLAGSSVGGLLAIALAFEVPMQQIVSLFQIHGKEVFSARTRPTGRVGRLIDLSRSVLGPKYSGVALRDALEHHFGEATLTDARHAVVIPAVNVSRSLTKVFKSPHVAASRGDEDVRAIDVTMAACAAPAYFPSVRIGSEIYADGGLFAVAPDQVALHEAEHFMGVSPGRVRMLSVGTAAAGYQPVEGVQEEAGAVGWLSDSRLILTLISVQQQHVQAMMEDRLGERYLRLDAPWPVNAGLGVDVATEAAARTLVSMGRATLAATDDALLRAFL